MTGITQKVNVNDYELDEIGEIQSKPTSKQMCMLHYNIRGLCGKVSELINIIVYVKDQGLTILQCETYLTEANEQHCKYTGLKDNN